MRFERLLPFPQTYPEFYHRPGDPVTAWRYVTDSYNVVNIPRTGAWKGEPLPLPTEDRTAYMRCYAETLDEYDIGWTLFTDFNTNRGPIVHISALEENISEPPGSGYVKHSDFYWDEPVLEILREYLPG